MRQLVKVLSLLLMAVIFSCDKKNDPSLEKGKVEFSISSQGISGGRSAALTSVLVSITDATGKSIFQRKQLTLISFGTEYLSEAISLTKGDFKLTEFIIVDENNAAIYATPLEGAPLAYLVNDPLPINFSVTKDQSTKVVPQVIKVDGSTGVDFGYATFGLDIVNTFQFSVGVLTYNSLASNLALATSHINITSGATVLFDGDEGAATNKLTIKDGYTNYTLTVTKSGYITYQKTFAVADLKAYNVSPLAITLLDQGLGNGLIAYYPFTGNSLDATSNHFDGVGHNGVVLTTDRKGASNSAYGFDGVDDYISVAHNNAFNFAGDFTISVWIKVAATQVDSNINDIVRKWNGNAEGYPFSMSYLNSTNLSYPNQLLSARFDSQTCGNAPNDFAPAITSDVFHHYVLVKQGNTLSNYVDNVLAGQVTDTTQGSGCAIQNTADVTIGTRGNLVRFFKGTIDDIRFYNRSLTTTEIASLFTE